MKNLDEMFPELEQQVNELYDSMFDKVCSNIKVKDNKESIQYIYDIFGTIVGNTAEYIAESDVPITKELCLVHIAVQVLEKVRTNPITKKAFIKVITDLIKDMGQKNYSNTEE